jgi:conjugal transfer pilus assembly protein TraU
VPHPGFVVSLWEPARLVELTRAPACSPALGGIRLPLGSRRLLGTAGKAEWDASDISFYNYHWYAFPLLVLLDLFFEDRCNADGMVDFDILYLSELDPTWNSSELAFFTNPEAAWLANPVALAACLADAASATAGTPDRLALLVRRDLGPALPLERHDAELRLAPERDQPLGGPRARGPAPARARPAHHGRRRPVRRPDRSLPAQVPVPALDVLPAAGDPARTTSSARARSAGASWRSLPGPGEDHLYLLWRWNDCCATF